MRIKFWIALLAVGMTAATVLGTREIVRRSNMTPPVSFARAATQVPGTPAIVRWQWNFGDPSTGALNTSTEQHPMHQFSHAKQYVVRLTVWDELGQSDTATRYVTVTK